MFNRILAAELDRMASKISRWADIDRGNITPTEDDAEYFDFELDDFEPEYINREQYCARNSDAWLLRRRAAELRKGVATDGNEVRTS